MLTLLSSIDLLKSIVEDMSSPWSEVQAWSPFRIDALGLVSLLGAEQLNNSIGSLQRRHFTEWLPFLAQFVVCGDDFCREQPGYSLYNLTDGIHTTELKGWFTRWLCARDILSGTTIYHWRVECKRKDHAATDLLSITIAFVVMTPLLFSTILIGDWFGLANAITIVLSVLTRQFMLWQRRRALNTAGTKTFVTNSTINSGTTCSVSSKSGSLENIAQLHREKSQPTPDDILKILVTRSDGKMVTIYAPRDVLFTMVRGSDVNHPKLYRLVQWLGWAAFGTHIVVLGMSTLFAQMFTVVLLVGSTWIYCHNFAIDSPSTSDTRPVCDGSESHFKQSSVTSQIVVEQETPSSATLPDKRMSAYVRLQPTDRQEAMMKHWSLLPFEGVPWYDDYEDAKKGFQASIQQASGTSKEMRSQQE